MSRRVVVASGNRGKIEEIARLLSGVELLPQSGFGVEPAEENGATFLDNALLKARHAARATGLPAIADDSGLAVDALHGRPGVRSARYAGPGASDTANVERLLSELAALGDAPRGAAFHCVAVFVEDADDPSPLVAEGQWRGEIAPRPRGSSGFGYDPVFVDPASAKTAAEMTPAEKDALSHRGRAFRKLARLLAEREASR